jgi:hypothetical protein
VLVLVEVPAFVTVVVTVAVTVTAFVEVLVVLRARAGTAIARQARTTATVNATSRGRLPPTRERLASLAFSAAFIARLP